MFSSNFKFVKSLNSVRILLAMLISLRVWKISILLTFYLKSIWTSIKDFKCIKASATKVHPKEICPPPFMFAIITFSVQKVLGRGWIENRQWLPNLRLKSIPSCSSTNFSQVGHSCLSSRDTQTSFWIFPTKSWSLLPHICPHLQILFSSSNFRIEIIKKSKFPTLTF